MSRRRRHRQQPEGPFELSITDLTTDARGVGHDAGGKAVFVADTLPGETVRYFRTKRRVHFDEGRLDAVLSPSAARADPRCKHFGVCGGCVLQHLDASQQIAFKQEQLLAALQRIGDVSPASILKPISGSVWEYRRRARLGVKHVPKKGRTLVGFRERGNPFVAELSACEVLIPEVGRRIAALQALIDGLSIRSRLPQIEVAGGDEHVALVLRVLDPPTPQDKQHLRAFCAATGLWIYLQPGGIDSITPLLPETPVLTYGLPQFDVQLAFEPTDFVQIHAEVNKKMVAQAVDLLALQPDDTVLDLFSGLGNFSLPLARRARQVVAVEGEAGLAARTAANAKANDLHNIQACTANLFDGTDAWLPARVDKVLLDPPRSGASEVLPLLAAKRPQRIVYCSCHPATLARDAGALVQQLGYRLVSAGVMDMFPHTAHVESMALFELAV